MAPAGGGYPYPQPGRPPYAMREGRRDPIEPWVESLKTAMLVFGVLLVACFIAPWSVHPGQTVFSWTILSSSMPASAKVLPILFASTGILSVLLGGLRMTMLPRGFAAAGIGLAPLIYGGVSPSFEWQTFLEIIGTVTLVPGLLVRSQYTGARIARLMVTVGAICVLLPQIIPDHGQVPLVEEMKALGSNQTVQALFMLFPVVLAVVSLIAWTPPPGRAAAHILAWTWIVWPLLAAIVLLLSGGHVGETLKSSLSEVLYIPLGHMAWTALVGYGTASVVGKQLE